jgi:hypothetical protein
VVRGLLRRAFVKLPSIEIGSRLRAAHSLVHESDHLENQVETFLDTVRGA